MIAPIAALIIAFTLPPPPTPPILTPAGEAAAIAWQAGVKAVRDRHAAAGPAKDRAEAVARLAELDRAARDGLKALESQGLSPEDLRGVQVIAWYGIGRLDEENTVALKRLAGGSGWFSIRRDGVQATADAALIVLHSVDYPFVQSALDRMTRLAANRQIDGRSYAIAYDLNEMERGRPQLYGTQAACQGKMRMLWPLAAGEATDAQRARIGWTDETLGETAAGMRIGEACTRDYVPPRATTR